MTAASKEFNGSNVAFLLGRRSGATIILHCKNPEPFTSALGQKQQTYAAQ